jgi:hypothetical protein
MSRVDTIEIDMWHLNLTNEIRTIDNIQTAVLGASKGIEYELQHVGTILDNQECTLYGNCNEAFRGSTDLSTAQTFTCIP